MIADQPYFDAENKNNKSVSFLRNFGMKNFEADDS